MSSQFRATKSQSQNRKGWSVIFHHPLLRNEAGKPKRVRKGLSTSDERQADEIVGDLNSLLGDDTYWTLAARERAGREYHERAVDIFYEGIEGLVEDSWASRESVIPLPSAENGYSRVQLVGPTGAGKTTLLRQLIGVDPRERFPSTSTAKTTVFDMEIISRDGNTFNGVVSFLPQDRVRSLIEECVLAAVGAAAEEAPLKRVIRRLLEHTDQRFRLSYILGTLGKGAADAEAEDDDDSDPIEDASEETMITAGERIVLQDTLREYLDRVVSLGAVERFKLEAELAVTASALQPTDRDTFYELLEHDLREDESAQSLVDDILDDVEDRLNMLVIGEYKRDRNEWPTLWQFATDDRAEFLSTVNRFSSNYAPRFGRLLGPVVQGLRVAGPFRPIWAALDDAPRLAIIDGEGLGHTAETASSLPTAITKRYAIADAILLVDNAEQPVQAATQAVLRSVAASGHEAKLVIAFTHLDQVTGDNLPDARSSRDHVLGSLENGIHGIDEALGRAAAAGLRRALDNRVFFLSRIDDVLPERARFTRGELRSLLAILRTTLATSAAIHSVPVYDLANFVLSIRAATEEFQQQWYARLGFAFRQGVYPEHWTRVKALSRRFAYQWEDQYDNMRPVADLIRLLSERLVRFLSHPRSWKPLVPHTDEMRQEAIDRVMRAVFTRLHDLAHARLAVDRLHDWGKAFDHSGRGSGRARARDVRAIYQRAAPVPDETPADESIELLDALRAMFVEAVNSAGGEVLGAGDQCEAIA